VTAQGRKRPRGCGRFLESPLPDSNRRLFLARLLDARFPVLKRLDEFHFNDNPQGG